MLFNSLTFLIFFAIFYSLYWVVKGFCFWRLLIILLGSIVFYGWWDWRFLLLIFATGTVDFLAAQGMQRVKQAAWRKVFLLTSVIFDLGMLSIFKYSSFVAENIEILLQYMNISCNLQERIPEFCLILPVGISFYTFQSLSYTIDVYRRELKPTSNFIHFLAYLMFFPQLVAGPIVRAKDLLFRLLSPPHITAVGIISGIKLIIIGFFKKCFIADNVAIYVNTSFAEMFACDSTLVWWLTMILFSIQIYGDFSGYSDIARGLAKMLGYRFPLNFNHPYAAVGFRDFWRRWHISLSSWFMNYVYLPLGGNVEKYCEKSKFNKLRTGFNLFVTMLLSGIWHGASWCFVLWGAIHGLLLSLERALHLPGNLQPRTRNTLKWLLMLFLLPQTWVFFRAENLKQIKHIFHCMYIYSPFPAESEIPQSLLYLLFFVLMEVYLYVHPLRFLPNRISKLITKYDAVGFAIMAFVIIFFRGAGNEFIYFQF